MATDEQIAALRKSVRKVVLAEIAVAWGAGSEPEDTEILEENLEAAKRELDDALDALKDSPTITH